MSHPTDTPDPSGPTGERRATAADAPSATEQVDVVVLGGGPAGLQAALTLGRSHRRVVVVDGGRYRNDPAGHLHNFLTRDGTPPAELRAIARVELAAYATVEVREARASAVEAAGDDLADGFVVTLEAAGERAGAGQRVRARRVLLATGLRDVLPAVAGLEELWGDRAAHCPYCHGHELSGQAVALLGSHDHLPRIAVLLERTASRLVVLTDGASLPEETAAALAGLGVAVRSEPVTALHRSGDGVRAELASGPDEEVGGIFVAPVLEQAAPFAGQLGLEVLASGGVRVDAMGRTSRPGVFAAGDLAHVAELPMAPASVLVSAAAGQLAAAAADADLVAERLAGLTRRVAAPA
ncbi:NAD(P)/FAD-dependent oxidoreductase [Nocardioides kribbensis]|uniref:NAD(P)/FAD-dependent oxidoreductase n=1 Tax=Nocardioides kribbensis TaxID=305517 RepID=UPI00187A176D|nr:NAD(P)/FAD-dependent oxidoreductase [Nocardioides kribbensis]